MVRVPISDENIDYIRMDLTRHYNVIDCDFTCYIVLNPSGSLPSKGTDIAVINIGSWQINTWSFLTKKMFPNIVGFSACLVWDKTLVQDSEQGRKAPRVTESDVDVSGSVSSLKGQPVNITGFSLDDGKSLKVSTLENEWVNIRPFKDGDFVYNIPIQSSWVRLSVGRSIDIRLIESFIVSNEGNVYTLQSPNIFYQFSSSSTVLKGSAYCRYGEGKCRSSATGLITGVAQDPHVLVTIDSNSIVALVGGGSIYGTANSAANYEYSLDQPLDYVLME